MMLRVLSLVSWRSKSDALFALHRRVSEAAETYVSLHANAGALDDWCRAHGHSETRRLHARTSFGCCNLTKALAVIAYGSFVCASLRCRPR